MRMMMTHLSPLNPLNVPTAAGGVPESRPEGEADTFPPEMQQIAAQQNVPSDFIDGAAQAFGTQVRFAVKYESHQVIVQVYDVETKKVIREIPPEQIVKVLSKIMDARDAQGLLLDEQA